MDFVVHHLLAEIVLSVTRLSPSAIPYGADSRPAAAFPGLDPSPCQHLGTARVAPGLWRGGGFTLAPRGLGQPWSVAGGTAPGAQQLAWAWLWIR